MNCPKCQNSVGENEKFCRNCGESLSVKSYLRGGSLKKKYNNLVEKMLDLGAGFLGALLLVNIIIFILGSNMIESMAFIPFFGIIFAIICLGLIPFFGVYFFNRRRYIFYGGVLYFILLIPGLIWLRKILLFV